MTHAASPRREGQVEESSETVEEGRLVAVNLHGVPALAAGQVKERGERRHEQTPREHLFEGAREIGPDARLHDVAASAAVERLADVLVRVIHAEEHRPRARSGLLQRATGLEAIDPGHRDVEDDEVWFDPACGIQGLLTICGDTDDFEVGRQQGGYGFEHDPVVIDQKDLRLESSVGLGVKGGSMAHR
jgi:hypothetical protein